MQKTWKFEFDLDDHFKLFPSLSLGLTPLKINICFNMILDFLLDFSFFIRTKHKFWWNGELFFLLQEPLHQPNLTMFKITNLAQCHHSICIKLYSPHCCCKNPKALFNSTQILACCAFFFHVTHLKISTNAFLANVCHLVTQKIQFAIHAKDLQKMCQIYHI